MHGPTIMRESCLAQGTRRAQRSALKPVKGRSSPSRTKVVIELSSCRCTTTSHHRTSWARDGQQPRTDQALWRLSNAVMGKPSLVYHGEWIPSYVWSHLDFNTSEESLVTGDVQEDSLHMKPSSSDSSCSSGTVSNSGSSSEAVPPCQRIPALQNSTW